MALLDAKILSMSVTPDADGCIVQMVVSDVEPSPSDAGSPLPSSSAISLALAVRVKGALEGVPPAQLQWEVINDVDSALQKLARDLEASLKHRHT